MWHALKAVLPLVTVLLLVSGLSEAQQCTQACPRSLPTVVVPKVQSTYVYSLESKTTLTPRDTQKVTIKADAELAIQSVCEAVLKLKNVVIEGVPDGADLATQLSLNPIQFGYFNGRVSGVCSTKDEPEWALNMKRAIVSAFQLASNGEGVNNLVEEDFSGKCPTVYQKMSNSGADGIIVEKKKELNDCTDRRIDLRQTPDQALGQLKELIRHYMKPIESSSTCKITLKDLVVSQVDCEERHYLFYRRDKPVHISNIKLSLKDTKTGIAADFANREFEKKDIFLSYEHIHKKISSEADIVETLKKLCKEVSGNSASIESSFTFDDLVSKLKYLPDDAATSVDEAVKSGSVCPDAKKRIRELFLDATAFAASDSSIKTLVNAFKSNELSVSRSTAAFTAVALKAAPKEDTIRALLPVISSDSATRSLLLGLSILTRRYCEKTADCEKNAALKEARDAFVERLGKITDIQDKVSMIKALENVNVNQEGNENFIKMMTDLINTDDTATSVKLAAVHALPNDPKFNDQLKSIVLKESNPNEIRMAGFRKLVNNKGLNDMNEFNGIQEHCVKNYILSHVKNIKSSKNSALRNLIPDSVQLSEQPSYKLGSSRIYAYEYGPFIMEFDIIYPEKSNVTRALNARVTRATNDKLINVVDVGVRQEGLDPQLGNIINMLNRKISLSEFGFEAFKHLTELIKKLKQKDHQHNTMQISIGVNGKNLIFTDAFEDMHTLMNLLKDRAEKVVNDKKIDRTIGGVLIDSKVVVPTITGLPLFYKLGDNFVIQINGHMDGDSKKFDFILNRSLVAGLHAEMKLKLKDNKLGYEYDGKLAVTPMLDATFEKKDKSIVLKMNMKDIERHTLIKLKQSLRESKSSAAPNSENENELEPEPRSDDCYSFFILNYCRKESHVKGLMFPNVEYYVTKPDKALSAIEIELMADEPNKESRKYTAKIHGVGAADNHEHLAEMVVSYPPNAPKEMKLLLKSPNNKFESNFVLNVDKSSNVEMKVNMPHFIDANIKGKMIRNPENDGSQNDIMIEYKFPDDPTTHTLKYKNKIGYNLKRTSKEKVANLDFSSEFESSRRPYLNHRTVVGFKYRPLKLNEIVLDFTYGEKLDRQLKFARTSNIEMKEMKPMEFTTNSQMNMIATDFDVNYDLKSDLKVFFDKNKQTDFDLKVKGKDLSKRAASGPNEIEGKVEYHNKQTKEQPFDQNMDAELKINGKEYSYKSEMKQTEPQKFAGKVTIQYDNDKKIFIDHRLESSNPTKAINLKAEADVTYSYKPNKNHFIFEARGQDNAYLVKVSGKENDEVFFNNDLKFEKNGKLKWLLSRPPRSYDIDVDNVLSPRVVAAVFSVKDRVYTIKMNRTPRKFIDIKVDGNDKAIVKSANAHLSIVDPTSFNMMTQANSEVKMLLDLFSSDRKASLMINAPKWNLVHDGEIKGSVLSRHILWNSKTKKDDMELNFNADMALKGSSITVESKRAEGVSNLKYIRSGDKVVLDIDTPEVIGKLDGDRKAGKISLKNKENQFQIESNYKCEPGKFVIQSVTSNNGKLEAYFARNEPSSFTLESPKVNSHMKLDMSSPKKTMSFDFENPNYLKKINAEYDNGQRYKYSSYGKVKSNNKEHKIEINGIPQNELNVDIDLTDMKFKVTKPQNGNKAQFSYTLNDYTETEEYDFDPHKSYYANWMLILRKYITSFIVD